MCKKRQFWGKAGKEEGRRVNLKQTDIRGKVIVVY